MINRKQKRYSAQSSQAGFTLIEALLAIIVVTIMMIAIAPAIVLSVATRVQAKRLELGTAAAQSYVDGVRSGTIPAPVLADIPLKDTNPPPGGSLSCVDPGGLGRKSFYCTDPPSDLYCIDNDETPGCNDNSFKDMIIQASGYHRTAPAIATPTDADKGYQLGIRVYRADAFKDSTDLKKSDEDTKNEASTFTAGAGDRKAPLVEMTTEISTSKTKYGDLCERQGGCGVPPD
jgi:type II secretory pathway pseudopilin PulG